MIGDNQIGEMDMIRLCKYCTIDEMNKSEKPLWQHLVDLMAWSVFILVLLGGGLGVTIILFLLPS